MCFSMCAFIIVVSLGVMIGVVNGSKFGANVQVFLTQGLLKRIQGWPYEIL
jgi:hypothetical protein